METKLLIALLVVTLIGSVGKQLYDAKKNDGVISKDEVFGIMQSIMSKSVSMFSDFNSFSTITDTTAKRTYIAKKFSESIYNSSLPENEKELLSKNMDATVDFILDHADEIIKLVESKKSTTK